METTKLRDNEFDVLALGEWDDSGRFCVKPSVMYLAMVERMKQVVELDCKAVELEDREVKSGVHPLAMHDKYVGQAKSLCDLDAALCPFCEVTEAQAQVRTLVLELARLWFTRAFKNRVASGDVLPVIRIEKDDNYRIHQQYAVV